MQVLRQNNAARLSSQISEYGCQVQTPFWMPSGSLLEVKIEVKSGDSFFNSY